MVIQGIKYWSKRFWRYVWYTGRKHTETDGTVIYEFIDVCGAYCGIPARDLENNSTYPVEL